MPPESVNPRSDDDREVPSGPTFRLDEEGLLSALVLAPSTYSRNRHYQIGRASCRERV